MSVTVTAAEVTVRVQDDGVGFDPAERTVGFGVAGMRERIAIAHGTLRTESGEGGTSVLATIPLATAGLAAWRAS